MTVVEPETLAPKMERETSMFTRKGNGISTRKTAPIDLYIKVSYKSELVFRSALPW